MQRYRGFDPRTAFARWGLLAIAVAIALAGSLPAAAAIVGRLVAEQPETVPWFVSRLLAILAYLAMTGSVVYGLLLSTGILDAIAHRPVNFALHQDLSAIGVALAAVHGALLLLDRTIHFSALDLLVPFMAPYRPIWVAAGQIALILAGLVVASFYARRRIGQRRWRLLHFTTFAVFIAATAHGIGSGTDTATPGLWWMYVIATALTTCLVTVRVVLAAFGGRRRIATAAGRRLAAPAGTTRMRQEDAA